MRRDVIPSDVIDMLVFWWRYENSRALVGLGYPTECPSMAQYRASRQYDDINGAAETDERGNMARMIGRLVDGMDEPYRTALYVTARNRATGVFVWSSPRLPEDRDECAEVVGEAIARFSQLL